jgi:hypothetical protein
MLDFYLIKDATSTSNHGLSKEDYAGGINDSEFDYLQNIHIIEDWLDYYQDFRWTNEQVNQKLSRLLDYLNAQKEPGKSPQLAILAILEKARQSECGLVAYAD